jgi:5'-nucleotidase
VPGHDPRGRPHFWITTVPLEAPDEGTDRWAVSQGWISLTPLRLDLTDEKALEEVTAAPA